MAYDVAAEMSEPFGIALLKLATCRTCYATVMVEPTDRRQAHLQYHAETSCLHKGRHWSDVHREVEA